ncbi:MAG: L-rhamnose/proton symporter RhaT [Oscillospiraceae bacterium]|jgi:L-rhamnose-H+ transport protein
MSGICLAAGQTSVYDDYRIDFDRRKEFGAMILGFVLLLAAGICQGSFGLGYKKYGPFSWAAFWGVYCILCIVVSAAAAWILAPRLWEVLFRNGGRDLLLPVFCGMLWGISAVGFSKAIDKIGMSMVYGVSMGISTVVGSVMPLVLNSSLPQGGDAVLFWAGLVITLAGVAVITVAGIKRDGGARGSVAGIVLAVLSGIGSGAMNIGFTETQRIGEELAALGGSYAAVSAARWLPVLVGGSILGVFWCVGELSAKREWKTLIQRGSLRRTAILFGVSIVWYAALLLYGLATEQLGGMGETVGWILFNALALVISSGIGILIGEWKQKCRPRRILLCGNGLLIVAWFCLAFVQ